MVSFEDRETQLELVLSLTRTTGDFQVQAEVLIDLSAAHIGLVAYYRPYWVAANLLEQNPKYQLVSSADGVGFTGMPVAIASYYRLQNAIDASNPGWVIPPGFEAPNIEPEGSTFVLPIMSTLSIPIKRV